MDSSWISKVQGKDGKFFFFFNLFYVHMPVTCVGCEFSVSRSSNDENGI